MSSFPNPINVKSASQSGQLSSNLVMAIAPVISEALVQNMEQQQKAKMEQEQKAKMEQEQKAKDEAKKIKDEAKKIKDEAKKTEKSHKVSSFN